MKIFKRRLDGKAPDEVIDTDFFIVLELADGTRFDLRENRNEPTVSISVDDQITIRPDASNKVTFGVAGRIPIVRANVGKWNIREIDGKDSK